MTDMRVYGILCSVNNAESNGWQGWLMIDEIERDLEGSGRDEIEILSRPLSNGTEKNHEIHRILLETSTSWYKYRALRRYQQILSRNAYVEIKVKVNIFL
jgi:hypothetical protein